MNLEERLQVLIQTGKLLAKKEPNAIVELAILKAQQENQWFTDENTRLALQAIIDNFMNAEKLKEWTSKYDIKESLTTPKKIGLVLAGNIPFVGIHDVMTCFVAGHQSNIKYSDKDSYLIPMIIKLLVQEDERAAHYFVEQERMNEVDAIIATGSNNSSRYFEHYFSQKPHIIRKNRSSIAVIDDDTSMDDLKDLAEDVYRYFGLGCRNVSKIYLPKSYKIEKVMEAFEGWKEIVLHNKYKNNFDYNYAIYLLNKVKFFTNGCIIAMESEEITSRISVLHFEYYSSKEELLNSLHSSIDKIQCIVSKHALGSFNTIPFGKAQSPELWDYSDGVDTLQFLIEQVP